MAARWGALSLLLALVAWKMDWSGVVEALGDSSWGLLGLAAVASLASGVSKAMIWQGLLAGMPSARGHSRPGDLISPLLVGALVNSVALARAGDVVKIMLARRLMARRGVTVPYTDLTGSMMAEHVVATVAWAALVGGIAIFQPMATPIWLSAVLVGLACLGFAVLTALRPPGPPGSRVGHGSACWQRALRALGGVWEGVHHCHRGLACPRRLVCVSLAGLAQWLFAWLQILAVLWALGLGWVGMGGAGMVLVCYTLAHAFPVTPGGLGTNQLGAMLPLTATYGIAAEQALAFAVALALTETTVGIVLGAACASREALRGERVLGHLRAEAPALAGGAVTPPA